MFLRQERLCCIPNVVRNVEDVNLNMLHPLYFHGIHLLQEICLVSYLTQITTTKNP